MSHVLHLCAFSLAAGLFFLDSTAIGQFMISQPLVACSVLGYLAGTTATGITVGFAFQLLFAGDLPIGSYLPANASLVSMAALGAAWFAAEPQHPPGIETAALAAILSLLAAPLYRRFSVLVRTLNGGLVPRVERLLARGQSGRALVLAQGGMALFFLEGFLTVFFFSLLAGSAIAYGASRLSPRIVQPCVWILLLMPLIGAGHLLGRALPEILARRRRTPIPGGLAGLAGKGALR